MSVRMCFQGYVSKALLPDRAKNFGKFSNQILSNKLAMKVFHSSHLLKTSMYLLTTSMYEKFEFNAYLLIAKLQFHIYTLLTQRSPKY